MSVLGATVVVVAVQSSLLWLLRSSDLIEAADRLALLGFLGWRTVPHCASSSRLVARLLYPGGGEESHQDCRVDQLGALYPPGLQQVFWLNAHLLQGVSNVLDVFLRAEVGK